MPAMQEGSLYYFIFGGMNPQPTAWEADRLNSKSTRLWPQLLPNPTLVFDIYTNIIYFYNNEKPIHLHVQEFGTTRAQPSWFSEHVLSLRLSNLDARPSVVAFKLHVSFCLVIQMHAAKFQNKV